MPCFPQLSALEFVAKVGFSVLWLLNNHQELFAHVYFVNVATFGTAGKFPN